MKQETKDFARAWVQYVVGIVLFGIALGFSILLMQFGGATLALIQEYITTIQQAPATIEQCVYYCVALIAIAIGLLFYGIAFLLARGLKRPKRPQKSVENPA